MARGEPDGPEAVAQRDLHKLTPHETELVASCARSLDVIRLGDPPALAAMAEALRQLIGGDVFATYTPERASTGWRIGNLLWHGAGSDFDHVGALEELMNRNPGGWQPGYTLRTVAIHVTGVLRKAACETRTEVLARLLVRRGPAGCA